MSDDGRHGLSVIAFVGSVFSPYYARARRKRSADPENHVAINVALYGPGGHRWAMTERGRSALARDPINLRIGPSRIGWQDGAFVVEIDEIAVPIPRRIRGRLIVQPKVINEKSFDIDGAGRHVWQPIAPGARVTVEFEKPKLQWQGAAYVDCNHGSEPLEAAFRSWSWMRTIEPERTRIFYDRIDMEGAVHTLGLDFTSAGSVEIAGPQSVALQRSFWGIDRIVRSQSQASARVVSAWEDGPFYARTFVGLQLDGEACTAVHETVSLTRFRLPIVQAMLPFRMPRRG
jgi:carotenoid 1,2-hydratase